MSKNKICLIIVCLAIGYVAGWISRNDVTATTRSIAILQDDKKEYNINDCITVFSDQNVSPNKAGWAFWFAPKSMTNGLNLKMSYVDRLPTTHPPHQHDNKEILYILEGEVEVYLNGETRIIGPNSSVFYPANSMHNITRVNDKPVKYLVINE